MYTHMYIKYYSLDPCLHPMILPSGTINFLQFAIEHGPVEIASFPMNRMVDLSIAFCWFTRE